MFTPFKTPIFMTTNKLIKGYLIRSAIFAVSLYAAILYPAMTFATAMITGNWICFVSSCIRFAIARTSALTTALTNFLTTKQYRHDYAHYLHKRTV